MSEEAKKARRDYYRRYRKRYGKEIREKKRRWQRKNKDRVSEYQVRYWERIAAGGDVS